MIASSHRAQRRVVGGDVEHGRILGQKDYLSHMPSHSLARVIPEGIKCCSDAYSFERVVFYSPLGDPFTTYIKTVAGRALEWTIDVVPWTGFPITNLVFQLC